MRSCRFMPNPLNPTRVKESIIPSFESATWQPSPQIAKPSPEGNRPPLRSVMPPRFCETPPRSGETPPCLSKNPPYDCTIPLRVSRNPLRVGAIPLNVGAKTRVAVVFGRGLVGEGVGDVRLLHGFFMDASPFVHIKAINTCFLCISIIASCCTNSKAAAFSDGVYRRQLFCQQVVWEVPMPRVFVALGAWRVLLFFSRHRHAVTVPGVTPLRLAASSGPTSCAKHGISAHCCAVHFAAIFPSSKTAF